MRGYSTIDDPINYISTFACLLPPAEREDYQKAINVPSRGLLGNSRWCNSATSIIPAMEAPIRIRSVAISSLFLMLIGWGGLYYIINYTYPYVWPRWAFFVLVLMAVTGTALPIVYLFHRRFPGEKPVEGSVIVRQALWFGIYAATLAWLQLGRLVTVYVVAGLAAALFAIEYLIRLREKAHWKPPVPSDEQPS